MEAFLLSDDRHGPASCQPSLSWGHAIPWRRVWAVCCLLFAVCCALVCCALVCDGVLGAFLVQGERNEPMPLFRSIPNHVTCAIFAALWAAVLVTRVGAVDPRVMTGHPVAAAHRIERCCSHRKTEELEKTVRPV